MNFNEKLISLRKSKGLSQEELGAKLNVSRQTISKWESCQSYPDFQRLVLLSDFFGLTLDELVKDIDVQEVREKNLNSERLNSIYSDVENAKKIIKWGIIIGGSIAVILLMVVIVLILALYIDSYISRKGMWYEQRMFVTSAKCNEKIWR